jgi:hypothetical protein
MAVKAGVMLAGALLLFLPTTAAEPADRQQEGCAFCFDLLLQHSM